MCDTPPIDKDISDRRQVSKSGNFALLPGTFRKKGGYPAAEVICNQRQSLPFGARQVSAHPHGRKPGDLSIEQDFSAHAFTG